MNQKQFLRNSYMNIRSNFPNTYINSISQAISNNFFNLSIYKQAKNIFIYLSLEKEINTQYIINQAKKDNKNIYCPVITSKNTMIFKKYNEKNLIKNKFNILEPLYEKEKISDNTTIIIVPTIIYNKNKYRIGYGGGYYDYFLKNNICLASVGICFESFICDFNPDYYDEKVDIIITEKNVY
ncbi:5-formyltetrahydrofolate cyclo-ligase [[Clostridium] colinum]|uniref:5-formyltetrahydrofolate cyclo-ligase n=1 Tax=[Clostridium] colinum TaxID=36835 RepID=UPI0020248B94|nr:5-formyltetrahydrofolate cyclo-ligase [[Clostridium] colinum]